MIPLFEDAIDCEKYLPENTFDQGGQDVYYHDMHKAEVKHDVDCVLRGSPTVIKGELRPSCLSKHLHHDVLGVDEGLEIRELPILVICG